MSHVNRITIEYQARTQIVDDQEALGVHDYKIHTHNGRPPRAPKNGDDLFVVRDELRALGFQHTNTDRLAIGHGVRDARYLERWHLFPPVQPPEPREFRTTIKYQRADRVFALIDRIETVGHYTDRPAAEWAQIEYEAPDVYRVVQDLLTNKLPRHPDQARGLEFRCLRAARLLALDHITPHPKLAHTYDILSQTHRTGGRIYRVVTPPHIPTGWTCTIHEDVNPDRVGTTCPDIASGKAPNLGSGPRCKHMTAGFLYPYLHTQNEGAPVHETEAPSLPKEQTVDHDTTLPATVQVTDRIVVARYADGRPARYNDGTVVRYTAGGRAVELPGG